MDKPQQSMKIHREWKLPGGKVVHDVYEGDIPEKYMDDYQKIIGDGLARMTVAVDFSELNYGTGCKVLVSASLACSQDAATMKYAGQLAGYMARESAKEQLQQAKAELPALLAGATGGNGPTFR